MEERLPSILANKLSDFAFARLKLWLERCEETLYCEPIDKLIQQEKYEELELIMSGSISFGTSGVRGIMGPGFKYLNCLSVTLLGQAIALYFSSKRSVNRKIIVSYDGRENSKSFALCISRSLVYHDFYVHFYKHLPTPVLAFAVKYYQALGGIMVTASHNPKEYNGIKVYGRKGCQVTNKAEFFIMHALRDMKELYFNDYYSGMEKIFSLSNFKIGSSEDVKISYTDFLANKYNFLRDFLPWTSYTPIVYTPLHGVAGPFVEHLFAAFGIRLFIKTKEQSVIDPYFSTLSFPNPEEPCSFDIARHYAESHYSNVIISNDPDGDRLGLAEKR